jgi:16S rRNA (uracil1498-N3)-methyltransferase
MMRRRFYAPAGAFAADRGSVQLAAEEARHLRDVLRLQLGDEVYVFDGAGHEFRGQVAVSGRDLAELNQLVEVEPAQPESPLDFTLAVALLKGEKFDLVTQKATELGVNRIIPVITERADVRLRDTKDASKRLVRWQRIALEAAKQSGRARVPEITEPRTFEALVKEESESLRIVFSERDGKLLDEAIENARQRPLIALVGSEGGWADGELASARDGGWKMVTLGGRILRAETAAIVVTALLQNLLGDLR